MCGQGKLFTVQRVVSGVYRIAAFASRNVTSINELTRSTNLEKKNYNTGDCEGTTSSDKRALGILHFLFPLRGLSGTLKSPNRT